MGTFLIKKAKTIEYKGKQYTPKEAIEEILNFLYFVEDNTNYEIEEISQAIDRLQIIEFKVEDVVEEKESKILDTINYSDIKHNYFNKWLTEALYYQCNIIFDKKDFEDDENDYKILCDIRDVDIQFREENDYDDDFDIAVYCKVKDNNEWKYVDNISRELYERRFE